MSYRKIITGNVLLWMAAAFVGRLPIAVAPLGLVFLVRDTDGGYALGATLAAAYVLGEVLGSVVLGAWMRPKRLHVHLAAGMAVGAAAFAGLALFPETSVVVTAALAFVAGAAPAAGPGGMRSMLIALVDKADESRALSAETVLTQITWGGAPALVVVLAVNLSPSAPMALGAVGFLAAAVILFLLPAYRPQDEAARQETGQDTDGKQAEAVGRGRVLASAWPIYLTSAGAMSMLATAELALTPLLEYRDLTVNWAGALLALFSLTSAAGAFLYGLRTWPGTVRGQSLVFLLITSVCVALSAVFTSLVGIAVAFLAAGVFQAGVMVTRSMSLRERLPEHAHTAGYSIQYAVQGVGYTLTASVAATVLSGSTPVVAILGGVGITVLLTLISAAAELRRRPEGHARPQSVREEAVS
ncbi:MFS transporter [Streptomyces sp. NBC_01264]|uniref:MFS transporter n=1 Tax=Streptomyces sp. NBC_01264 TaxID=2903804 RepID=UPI0022567423|nr:MFS transporter [Streptomyces sp. NBC_01264]MCX4783051.1 MFS transporter [Streptomyces sp. NBC_01264]